MTKYMREQCQKCGKKHRCELIQSKTTKENCEHNWEFSFNSLTGGVIYEVMNVCKKCWSFKADIIKPDLKPILAMIWDK